jgi:hypothetical protein
MRVLFYVQHLIGIGHVKRCSVLVRAMLRRGLDVAVVAGGRPLPGIDFGEASIIRLPMLEALDAETYRLVDERARRATPWLWWRRKRELLRAGRGHVPLRSYAVSPGAGASSEGGRAREVRPDLIDARHRAAEDETGRK